METFSALLAICARNSPVHGEFPAQRPVFSLICVWINGWVNNREAGDLRRHCSHYDVIVMDICVVSRSSYEIVYYLYVVWLKYDEISIYVCTHMDEFLALVHSCHQTSLMTIHHWDKVMAWRKMPTEWCDAIWRHWTIARTQLVVNDAFLRQSTNDAFPRPSKCHALAITDLLGWSIIPRTCK